MPNPTATGRRNASYRIFHRAATSLTCGRDKDTEQNHKETRLICDKTNYRASSSQATPRRHRGAKERPHAVATDPPRTGAVLEGRATSLGHSAVAGWVVGAASPGGLGRSSGRGRSGTMRAAMAAPEQACRVHALLDERSSTDNNSPSASRTTMTYRSVSHALALGVCTAQEALRGFLRVKQPEFQASVLTCAASTQPR